MASVWSICSKADDRSTARSQLRPKTSESNSKLKLSPGPPRSHGFNASHGSFGNRLKSVIGAVPVEQLYLELSVEIRSIRVICVVFCRSPRAWPVATLRVPFPPAHLSG